LCQRANLVLGGSSLGLGKRDAEVNDGELDAQDATLLLGVVNLRGGLLLELMGLELNEAEALAPAPDAGNASLLGLVGVEDLLECLLINSVGEVGNEQGGLGKGLVLGDGPPLAATATATTEASATAPLATLSMLGVLSMLSVLALSVAKVSTTPAGAVPAPGSALLTTLSAGNGLSTLGMVATAVAATTATATATTVLPRSLMVLVVLVVFSTLGTVATTTATATATATTVLPRSLVVLAGLTGLTMLTGLAGLTGLVVLVVLAGLAGLTGLVVLTGRAGLAGGAGLTGLVVLTLLTMVGATSAPPALTLGALNTLTAGPGDLNIDGPAVEFLLVKLLDSLLGLLNVGEVNKAVSCGAVSPCDNMGFSHLGGLSKEGLQGLIGGVKGKVSSKHLVGLNQRTEG